MRHWRMLLAYVGVAAGFVAALIFVPSLPLGVSIIAVALLGTLLGYLWLRSYEKKWEDGLVMVAVSGLCFGIATIFALEHYNFINLV